MENLLPHYERELAFLRSHAGDFARQYPKIAGRLKLSGDVGEDPHVERLIESFALLSSRIHKRLDDDFPLFTESFLEVLYPHYLRPFPSCAIVRFDVSSSAGSQMTRGAVVERGSMLNTRPVRGITCKFRTTYDVDLLPVEIVGVTYRSAVSAPSGSDFPRGATSDFQVELALTSDQAQWAALGAGHVRVYLDGEASQVSALREALCGRVLGCALQTDASAPWIAAAGALPEPVGFAESEALIDFDARSHPAYRLLTEYFGFPEKFNFVDLPLPQALLATATRRVTLHYLMGGVRGDSHEGRLLETINEKNLLTGCTPVVNLFRQKADPIRVTHAAASYPVLPDGRRAYGYEVHAIERVYRLQQTPQGETICEFRPFYSLQHDELLSDGETGGRYWHAHRDDELAGRSPGFETELSIVDVDFDPASAQTDTLSVDVSATNRDLPSLLSIGAPGGDLTMEGGSTAREIRFMRKPSTSHRFARGHGAHWRLISHLSLNHLSLSGGGVEALKELLRLYDLPRSATNRRLLDGIVSIDYAAASACLPGNPFATFVRGTEIRLAVDEQHFVGSGLRLFAQVLDHFFGLYVHTNSFSQLKIVSARTQEELIVCPRRSGDSPLL